MRMTMLLISAMGMTVVVLRVVRVAVVLVTGSVRMSMVGFLRSFGGNSCIGFFTIFKARRLGWFIVRVAVRGYMTAQNTNNCERNDNLQQIHGGRHLLEICMWHTL